MTVYKSAQIHLDGEIHAVEDISAFEHVDGSPPSSGLPLPRSKSAVGVNNRYRPGMVTTAKQPVAATIKRPVEVAESFWDQLVAGFQLENLDDDLTLSIVQGYVQTRSAILTQIQTGAVFLPELLKRIQARNLPTELALLPGIESGYQPKARSPSGALGIWQFMPATGRQYGLTQSPWYDGRMDTFAATRSALDLLARLHAHYQQDWLLALAAYNAGPANIDRALLRNRNLGLGTHYKDLALTTETRLYVRKLIALRNFIRQQLLSRQHLPPIALRPSIVKVNPGYQIDLNVAAGLAAMNRKDFRFLNAAYKLSATSPAGPWHLYVPTDKALQFTRRLRELAVDKRIPWFDYQIRLGDSLSEIAARFGISVAALQNHNGLNSSQITAGKRLRIPRLSANSKAGSNWPAPADPDDRLNQTHHLVVRGDSLWTIARYYGVQLSALRLHNSLPRRSILRPGQTIRIPN